MEAKMEEDGEQLPKMNTEILSKKRKRRHYSYEDKGDIANELSGPAQQDRDEEAPPTKYREIETPFDFTLVDFSDEVLVEIFQHLDSWALLALMNCTDRFYTLGLDNRFWRHIDLIKEPLPLGILLDVLERTHVNTRCVKLRGPSTMNEVSTEIQRFNKTILNTFAKRCTQLTVLELQGVTIDFRLVRILDFPKTLKRLIFNDCTVRLPESVKSIFSGIDSHLTDLQELGIENSDWFEPYYIMIFSKVPALRSLSLKGCQQLSDFVPYGSMASRFGFKQLEYLDLRFTPLTDSDLQCFNAILTLKEMLLDCPEQNRNDEEKKMTQATQTNCDDCQASTSAASTSASASASSSSSSSAPVSSSSSSGSVVLDAATPSTSSATSQLNVTISLSPPAVGLPAEQQCASPSSSISSNSSISSSSSSTSPSTSPEMPPARQVPAEIFPLLRVPDELPFPQIEQRTGQGIIIVHQNRRRPILIQGRNYANHLDRVLAHPLFWDMINPNSRQHDNLARALDHIGAANDVENRLGLEAPADGDAAAGGSHRPRCFFYDRTHYRHRQRIRNPISDRGICCFGRPTNPVEQGVIWIRIGNRSSENRFERLYVRNYKRVTDISLAHLVQCSPYLVFLDLSGTSVTREGIQRFKLLKPECQIVADHLIDSSDENTEENAM